MTLPEIVDLALRNNPMTRESWAQAQAYADAYGAARSNYFPVITAAFSSLESSFLPFDGGSLHAVELRMRVLAHANVVQEVPPRMIGVEVDHELGR